MTTRTSERDRVDGQVLVVFAEGIEDKRAWISMHPEALFDQAHYRNGSAYLVKLDDVAEDVLADALEHSYRQKAPKSLVKTLDAG